MIKNSESSSLTYPNRKLGDNPTDSRQLTPRGYVSSFVSGQFSSVLSSISGGFTFTGNLAVLGSESVLGTLDVSYVQVINNLDVGGKASVGGNLQVGGNASIVGLLYTDNMINGGTILLRGVAVPNTYTGRVLASGAVSAPFPSGWSSASVSAGLVAVTHNLGTTLYGVTATGESATVNIGSRQTNSFEISTRSADAASVISAAFEFVVVKP